MPMSTNLVSQIMQFLTPEMISRIASVLGLDRGKVQSGISAAVPALLSGLSGVATRPAGTQRLADAAKQHNDTLANFANMLSVGGQPTFTGQGSKLLASLLGDRGEDALAGAISKFAGLSEGASTSLLGMLAPVVMGGIARQSNGLSADGIANLFASQKDNIAAALPADVGRMLSGTGLLDAVGGAARAGTAAAGQAARHAGAAAYAVGDAGHRAARSASSASRAWLYWLIPAAAVVALLLFLVGRPVEQVAERSMAAVETVGVAAANKDIGKSVNASLDSLRTTLSGITDAASAQAALPKLQNVMTQIDKVGGRIEQLSAEERKAIAGVVKPAAPMIKEWIDTVLAVPGVAEVIKPTLDKLKTKFAKLTA
jgi:Bacterial protein of unknown function (DUF937)